jgi:hypothetical protein
MSRLSEKVSWASDCHLDLPAGSCGHVRSTPGPAGAQSDPALPSHRHFLKVNSDENYSRIFAGHCDFTVKKICFSPKFSDIGSNSSRILVGIYFQKMFHGVVLSHSERVRSKSGKLRWGTLTVFVMLSNKKYT